MSEHPILFSAATIRAILDGRKTMTRRVLKSARVFATPERSAFTLKGDELVRALQNADRFRNSHGDSWYWESDAFEWQKPSTRTGWFAHIGFAPGDRLWVREAHYLTDDGDHARIVYAADDIAVRDHINSVREIQRAHGLSDEWAAPHLRKRPSIHMPRWASRITLAVEAVRVERLHDISEGDAEREGATRPNRILEDDGTSYIDGFAAIWEDIHGPDAWDANPWVSVTTFCRIVP